MDSLEKNQNQAPWGIIVVIVALVVGAVVAWQFFNNEPDLVIPEPAVTEVLPEPIEAEETIVESAQTVEPEVVTPPALSPLEPVEPNPLPSLNESDTWVQEQLSALTWRKELLKLVINEDMVRRFVVFTDNFARGTLAYEHSPFTAPSTAFTALEERTNTNVENTWIWDENTTRRFSLYVDLLRSMDSDTLVDWYIEAKPLVDQAYSELGYPDGEFTEILQSAITRVLDMEIPKEPLELVRPSVMYRYKNSDLEALDDADKLLLRLGKDNLLVIKSVLLEINEKLARESNK